MSPGFRFDENPERPQVSNCAGLPGAGQRLPGEDSNLDKQDQNLLCYHYTTG